MTIAHRRFLLGPPIEHVFGSLLLLSLLATAPSAAFADAPPPSEDDATSAQEGEKGAAKLPPVVEFSFGQSQLFIARSTLAEVNGNGGDQLPTTSALLLGEWLFAQRWGLMAVWNLPLTTQKTVIDGKVFEEKAAPSVSVGFRWSPLVFEFKERARLEVQFAALVYGVGHRF